MFVKTRVNVCVCVSPCVCVCVSLRVSLRVSVWLCFVGAPVWAGVEDDKESHAFWGSPQMLSNGHMSVLGCQLAVKGSQHHVLRSRRHGTQAIPKVVEVPQENRALWETVQEMFEFEARRNQLRWRARARLRGMLCCLFWRASLKM